MTDMMSRYAVNYYFQLILFKILIVAREQSWQYWKKFRIGLLIFLGFRTKWLFICIRLKGPAVLFKHLPAEDLKLPFGPVIVACMSQTSCTPIQSNTFGKSSNIWESKIFNPVFCFAVGMCGGVTG